MNSEFKLPSEDEVRRAYQIPPSQPIRIEKSDSLPDPSWVKKIGGYLEEAADFFGVPTFLLRAGGIIVAVFFLPFWGPKVKEEVKSAVVISYDYWVGPFQQLPYQTPDLPFSRYAVVTAGLNSVSQNIAFLETGHLQAGTALYPISGSRV